MVVDLQRSTSTNGSESLSVGSESMLGILKHKMEISASIENPFGFVFQLFSRNPTGTSKAGSDIAARNRRRFLIRRSGRWKWRRWVAIVNVLLWFMKMKGLSLGLLQRDPEFGAVGRRLEMGLRI
ncbi:hypothetical protein U1Q18_016952 [Sarracenia purpurea var. burkii]